MKTFLLIMGTIGAALTALAGLDITGIITFLPDKWAPFLVIIPPASAAGVHFIMTIGDLMDDGEKNGSFGFKNFFNKTSLIIFFLALLSILLIPSCGVLQSVVTDTELITEPVTTERGKVLNVPTSDVLRAESSPEESIWGLYDAGAVKSRIEDLFPVSDSSK